MKRHDCGLSLSQLRGLHLGELDDPQLRARAEACPHCTARLASMEAQKRAFLEQTDVLAESQAILNALERPDPDLHPKLGLGRARVRRWLAALLKPQVLAPLATVAVVLVVALPRLPIERLPRNRTKGIIDVRRPGPRVALKMYVKDQRGYHTGHSGEVLHEGDQIQFRYSAAGHRFLFIASLDGRGTLTPLYPDTPTQSVPVLPQGLHVLEGSVILDDAVGPERIFAFFSDHPVRFEEIEAARLTHRNAKAIEQLDLKRDDVDETTILIIKE